MEEEISILEKDLLGDRQSIGFCHNDLQYGNIMLDEETRSITIIVIFCFYWISIYLLWCVEINEVVEMT